MSIDLFKRIIIGFCILCLPTSLVAQDNSLDFNRALDDIVFTITKRFDSLVNDTGKVVEQTAIVELKILEGKVVGCSYWSLYEKDKTEWLNRFFEPILNKYYKGLENLRYVVIPLKINDFRSDAEHKEPLKNKDFLAYFSEAYRKAKNDNVTVTRMLVLSAEWFPKKEKKKVWGQ